MIASVHNKLDYLFLFLLLPFFVLGVPETNYLIGFFLIYFIIFRKKNLLNTVINYKYVVIIFFSFYFILILSTLLSNHRIYSLETSLLYFVYLIYIFSILIIFQSNEKIEIYFLFFGTCLVFVLSMDDTPSHAFHITSSIHHHHLPNTLHQYLYLLLIPYIL